MDAIFQNPLFMGTAVYVGIILLLPRFLLEMLRGMQEENRENWNPFFLKVDYYYFIFIQFVIAIFAVVVSIYAYEWLETNLESFSFFQKYASIFQICTILMAIIIMNKCEKKYTVRPSGMGDVELHEEVSSLRLLGSIFAVVHLIFIKCFWGTNQYDSLLLCYIVLVIGRFVYFDSSLRSIWAEIKKMIKHLWTVLVVIVAIYLPLFGYVFKDISITTENILFSLCVIYLAMLFGVNSYKDISKGMFT